MSTDQNTEPAPEPTPEPIPVARRVRFLSALAPGVVVLSGRVRLYLSTKGPFLDVDPAGVLVGESTGPSRSMLEEDFGAELRALGCDVVEVEGMMSPGLQLLDSPAMQRWAGGVPRRMALCRNYGHPIVPGNASAFGQSDVPVCAAEEISGMLLPRFEARPGEAVDLFDCGCLDRVMDLGPVPPSAVYDHAFVLGSGRTDLCLVCDRTRAAHRGGA